MVQSHRQNLPEELQLLLWHRGDPPSWILQHLDREVILQLGRAYVEMQQAVLQAQVKYAESIHAALGRAGQTR